MTPRLSGHFAILTLKPRSHVRIDLFTDMEAILNLLDLRSIMGCPGGTRLVFTCVSRAKKRTSLYISREKGDYYYIQTRHNDLSFPLQSYSGKT